MRKIKRYFGVFLILFLAGSILMTVPCQAASAKVDLTADKTEVTVGDIVHIYTKINSQTIFGDFEANLTYDKSILNYQKGASVITGGNGYLKISDMGNDQVDTSRKYALEFLALKAGTCEITFDGSVMVYDASGNELPVSSDTLTITVVAKKTASTNAKLKSLVASPVDIIPTFDKNVFEYSVNVDNAIERLILSAIPEDNKSNVSIIGNDFLNEGENIIVITVLAESGDIIEYTINAIREAAPTVTIAPSVTPVITQDNFTISNINGETVIECSNGGKYTLVEPGSDVVKPEGYIKTELPLSGGTITAYVPSDKPESEFVLIYAKNTNGKEAFYQYDRIENTLQRYVEVSNNSEDSRAKMKTAAFVVALLSANSILMGITLIIISLKFRRYYKEHRDNT